MFTKVDLALVIMLMNGGAVLRRTLRRAGALENLNTRVERKMKNEELAHAYKYNGDNIYPTPIEGRVRKGEVIYVLTDLGIVRLAELGFKIRWVDNADQGESSAWKYRDMLIFTDMYHRFRSGRITISDNQL